MDGTMEQTPGAGRRTVEAAETGRREVVVITGASAGVGRAVAQRFARAGARIGLIARGLDGLEGARRDVVALGGEALICQADVADADQVEQAAARVEEAFGPIDVWINNATTSVFSPVSEMEPAEYRRVTEVGYLGVVHGTLAALRRMRARDAGTIVQVGSALAFRAIPLQSAYCAAKHASQGFTESLRTELIHDGSKVHVTTVNLPAVNTPQFNLNRTRLPRHPQPVPPIFQPEVPAEAIYVAAHSRRRSMTVGMSTAIAMQSNCIAPGFADWHLARNAWEGQMTDDPVDPDRPDNLWQPVPGDHGAHGIFDDQAHGFSLQTWLTLHREAVALLAAAAFAGLWFARGSRPPVEPGHLSDAWIREH
jgi:short-subunit dehydrogenase